LFVTAKRNAGNGRAPAQRILSNRAGVRFRGALGRWAIHSTVAPGWKSHSTIVPSAGVESLHDPPRTDVPAPESAAMTPSAVSGIPLSPSTFRTSSVMPRTAIMRWRLDAVVSAGL
jgi:hypothetical protein